jgi:hypothetical protein
MSRSWARRIEKNKKQVNEQRKKRGQDGVTESKTEVRFVGRSWLLPLFLLGMLIWYLMLFIGEKGFMYWLTVVGYSVLILFLFFVKRPFLVVGKDFVESRRFGGVVRVTTDEIEKILIANDSVSIYFNVKRPSWMFTSLFQRMNIPLMREKLQAFCETNQIPCEEK